MIFQFIDGRRTHKPRFIDADDHNTRILIAGAWFCVAMFIVLLSAMAFDARTLEGANVWVKPLKFAVSLAVHFLTLAILAQQLPRRIRAGTILTIPVMAAIAALVLEMVYISVQAARARQSHYNYETGLEAIMYAFMGIGAVLLVLVALVLAIQVWRHGQRENQGLRWGTILGLCVGFVTSLIFAGYMSSAPSRWVGEPTTWAVIPILGWSLEVGDLRPAHFVSLHLMQTLPLIGYIADRLKLPARTLVVIALVLQVGLATAVFFQARAGQPLWPM